MGELFKPQILPFAVDFARLHSFVGSQDRIHELDPSGNVETLRLLQPTVLALRDQIGDAVDAVLEEDLLFTQSHPLQQVVQRNVLEQFVKDSDQLTVFLDRCPKGRIVRLRLRQAALLKPGC